MEFAILHKIVLIVVANCAVNLVTIDQNKGFFVPKECNQKITREALSKCNLKIDDFETCMSKIKPLTKAFEGVKNATK